MADIFGGGADDKVPRVDVKETLSEIVFVAELPGIRGQDIDVELKGSVLTIQGRRDIEEDEEVDRYLLIERDSKDLQRSFKVNFPIKPECIKASLMDGRLTVVVPKSPEIPPQSIQIQIN
jgi:HSP20 family protein